MGEQREGRTASAKLALASLVLALSASSVLAFAPIGTQVEAVEIQGPGAITPQPAFGGVSHPSLLAIQGRSVLAPLSIPIVISAVGLAIRRWALGAAAIALLLFSIVGAASIGVFYVPSAAAMAFAAGKRAERARNRFPT